MAAAKSKFRSNFGDIVRSLQRLPCCPLKDLTLFALESAQKCEFRFEVIVPTGETPPSEIM